MKQKTGKACERDWSAQMTFDVLRELCMPCLKAYGLILDEHNGTEAALLSLKNDEISIVVKARCVEGHTIKHFVLKRTSESIFSKSTVIAEVEKALLGNSQGVTIPARRLALEGAPFWSQSNRNDWSNAPELWGVTLYEPNDPSFDWLGSPASWTDSHAYSAGALLAVTHQAAKPIDTILRGQRLALSTSVAPDVPAMLADAMTAAPASYLKTIGVNDESQQTIITVVARAVLNIVAGPSAARLKADEQLVHGDFQPGNVLYRGTDAVGVLDWDYARTDSPLLDIAYGLIMYSTQLCSNRQVDFELSSSQSFLQGYIDGSSKNAQSLPFGMPKINYAEAGQEDEVFSDYLKITAALIMLWSLAEIGQKHQFGVTVGRRTMRLICRHLA